MIKAKTVPIAMKIIKVTIKTIDLPLESNPIASVKRESEIKAQISAPPLSSPVI